MTGGWIGGLAIYLIIWWLVLFMVLPFGVRPIAERDVAKGQAAGAPERPRLWLKMLVTTLIAGLIWGVVAWMIASGMITLRSS